MKSNLSIFINGINIGQPVLGQGANTLNFIVDALCAAKVENFSAVLYEDTNILLSASRLYGDKVEKNFGDIGK